MHAQIHSYDELKSNYGERPTGKKTTVSSAHLNLSVEGGSLVIRAGETDQGSSVLINDAATTPVTRITREATIRFTPDDLRSLFQTALTEKLVTLEVTRPHPNA